MRRERERERERERKRERKRERERQRERGREGVTKRLFRRDRMIDSLDLLGAGLTRHGLTPSLDPGGDSAADGDGTTPPHDREPNSQSRTPRPGREAKPLECAPDGVLVRSAPAVAARNPRPTARWRALPLGRAAHRPGRHLPATYRWAGEHLQAAKMARGQRQFFAIVSRCATQFTFSLKTLQT